jgi:hypothetical protein
MERTVISKSAKRKCGPGKPGTYTEMVVYRGNGKSFTKHEPVKDRLQP